MMLLNKADITQSLTAIASDWLNSQYVLRHLAIEQAAQEFGLSKASFEFSLDGIFEQWTEKNILAGFSKIPLATKENDYVVQILAGNTPAMIAQGFFQGAILNRPQCLKVPHKQTSFANLLHQSFKDKGLVLELEDGSSRVLLNEKLAQAALILAYGRDETIKTLHQYCRSESMFIGHGHAESAAIIFKEASNLFSLEQLAYDMLTYDQRGCLSPRMVFVEEGGLFEPAECAKIFAEKILPEVAKKLPGGEFFSGESAEILHQRVMAGFRGQVYMGSDWTVSYDKNLTWSEIALPRFLLFKPFENRHELMDLLASKRDQLMSLGYAGSEEAIEPFKKMASYISFLGEMQKKLLIF